MVSPYEPRSPGGSKSGSLVVSANRFGGNRGVGDTGGAGDAVTKVWALGTSAQDATITASATGGDAVSKLSSRTA